MSNELYHFGIKGMKWGVRRSTTNGTSKGSNEKTPRELKKEAKQLKKTQKDWDDNVNKNWVHAYNKAAEEATKTLIPKINEKYKDHDFSDLSDPKIKKIHEDYVNEYEMEFQNLYNKRFDEMFGKRPE